MASARAVGGLVCAAAVAALGALMLGEYEFTGTLPFIAGPLFGLVVGEVAVGVGRSRGIPMAIGVAAVAFAGIAWAGWIDSTEGVEPVKGLVWVAAVIAAATAAMRTVGFRRAAPADGGP